MSHELRTPMNCHPGHDGPGLGRRAFAALRDYLQTVKDSAEVLLGLVNQVLDFSRIEAGRFELDSLPLSLRRCRGEGRQDAERSRAGKGPGTRLRRASRRARPARRRLLAAAADFDEPCGQRDQIHQARARGRAGRGRGRIPVSNLGFEISDFKSQIADFRFPAARRRWSQARCASRFTLRFSVSDTGIGISAEDQQRIFAPFTQVDASTTRHYGGSGLGLSITRSLVELMGGRIWVESEPSGGSTFFFTVRFCWQTGEPPAERSRPAAPPLQPTARPLRILLAEDTPANQKVAVHVLGRRGHAVEVAIDGRQAIQCIECQDFDAVLMDVQMPLMDGFEATARIRGLADPIKARLPVIAMTAHALKGDQERCLAAGMDAYISKPIVASDLIEVVEPLTDPGRRAAGNPPPTLVEARRAEERPVADSPPAFDLHEALEKCVGQHELLQDVADTFFADVDDILHDLSQAACNRDASSLANTAHRLKSTVVYLGAATSGGGPPHGADRSFGRSRHGVRGPPRS